VQQVKPADSPSQPLKASLANQQQRAAPAAANCTGERSPRRPEETADAATGGPENGRLAEGARENGAAAGENGPRTRRPEDEERPLEDGRTGLDGPEDEELEPAAQRIKRERLDERIRLSPLREDEERERPDKINDTEGTKVPAATTTATTRSPFALLLGIRQPPAFSIAHKEHSLSV
jgi:hypothetical protein